jgi:hypothetical protein
MSGRGDKDVEQAMELIGSQFVETTMAFPGHAGR